MFHYELKLNRVNILKDHLLELIELLLCFFILVHSGFFHVKPISFIFQEQLFLSIQEEFQLFILLKLELMIFIKVETV